MKSKPVFGIVSFFIILSFVLLALCLAGCDNGTTSNSDPLPGNVPEKWHGTYKFTSSNDYLNIYKNYLVYTDTAGVNTSINNLSVQYGGTVKAKGVPTDNGEWVYLLSNGKKIGVLIQNRIETIAGIGNGVITAVSWQVVQWDMTPLPSFSGISASFSFQASKVKTVIPPPGQSVTYKFDVFTITKADFNSVTIPTSWTFTNTKNFYNALRAKSSAVTIFNYTDSSEEDIYDFLISNGLTTENADKGIASLNSTGNNMFRGELASDSNRYAVIYVEKN